MRRLNPVVLLSGCASLSERDCRGGDWYNIGVRDGDDLEWQGRSL